MPDKSWVKFDKKLSVAAKRKFGVRNSNLNRKLAFLSNYKKHFWASYQSQKIVLEDWFFIFFSRPCKVYSVRDN